MSDQQGARGVGGLFAMMAVRRQPACCDSQEAFVPAGLPKPALSRLTAMALAIT